MPKARLKKARKRVRKRIADNQSNFDVTGSYTGINLYDMFDEPVQDADDL